MGGRNTQGCCSFALGGFSCAEVVVVVVLLGWGCWACLWLGLGAAGVDPGVGWGLLSLALGWGGGSAGLGLLGLPLAWPRGCWVRCSCPTNPHAACCAVCACITAAACFATSWSQTS